MSSLIFFRMHHGKQSEQVSFDGQGLRLLELKKAIVEKKAIMGSLDFDLKVTDENDPDKVYGDDDEMIPKNSSVVVKRIPAKSAQSSLMARINAMASGVSSSVPRSGHMSNAAAESRSHDIVINVQNEAPIAKPSVPTPMPAPTPQAFAATSMAAAPAPPPLVRQVSELATSAVLADDESEALKAISAAERQDKASEGLAMRNIGRRAPFVPQPPPVAGGHRLPLNYHCHRCGQSGHYIKYCPTNGDPNFDPVNRLLNVPQANRKKLTNLEGIDTANKTVVKNSDGTYEIFEPSKSGREKIARESESVATTSLELAEAMAPDNLRCPLTKTLLRDAVVLPCCKMCVNDNAIRQELLNSGLRCPLCSTENVSPDSLIVQREVREMVENFITSVAKKPQLSDTVADNANREQPLSEIEATIRSQFEEVSKPQISRPAPPSSSPFPPMQKSPMMHPFDQPRHPSDVPAMSQRGMYHNYPDQREEFPFGMDRPPFGPPNPQYGNMMPPMSMLPPQIAMGPQGMGPSVMNPPMMPQGMGPGMGMGGQIPPMGMPNMGMQGVGPMLGPHRSMNIANEMNMMGPTPFGMWRSPADIPREAMFPPLSEEDFYRDRQLQIQESKFFEERRQQRAEENRRRYEELRRNRERDRVRDHDSRDRGDGKEKRDRGRDRNRDEKSRRSRSKSISESRSRSDSRESVRSRSRSDDRRKKKEKYPDNRRDRRANDSKDGSKSSSQRNSSQNDAKDRVRDNSRSKVASERERRSERDDSRDKQKSKEKRRDESPSTDLKNRSDRHDQNAEKSKRREKETTRDLSPEKSQRNERDKDRSNKPKTSSHRSASPHRSQSDRKRMNDDSDDRNRKESNIPSSDKKRPRDEGDSMDVVDSHETKSRGEIKTSRDIARDAIRGVIREAKEKEKQQDKKKEISKSREKIASNDYDSNPSKRQRQENDSNANDSSRWNPSTQSHSNKSGRESDGRDGQDKSSQSASKRRGRSGSPANRSSNQKQQIIYNDPAQDRNAQAWSNRAGRVVSDGQGKRFGGRK